MEKRQYITIAWLKKAGACSRAIQDFRERSGTKASVKTVIKNLHKIGKSDWEAWLLGQELGLTITMIENGANIHADEDDALGWAAYKGHLDIVKYLLKNGLDIHAKDDVALKSASEGGRIKVVKYLVNKGADIHANDDLAIRTALDYNQFHIVEYLKRIIKKEKQ